MFRRIAFVPLAPRSEAAVHGRRGATHHHDDAEITADYIPKVEIGARGVDVAAFVQEVLHCPVGREHNHDLGAENERVYWAIQDPNISVQILCFPARWESAPLNIPILFSPFLELMMRLCRRNLVQISDQW